MYPLAGLKTLRLHQSGKKTIPEIESNPQVHLMNDTAKSLLNSKASSSGTRSRVATNAANTASIDEEFSAFFDQGDAGDYVGGLSESPLSVDPVTYDELREEHSVVKPRERRAFFAKVVTVVVAGCAALMMVAVGLKSLPSQVHARQSAAIGEMTQNRETLSPKALATATPNNEKSAVAAASRSELPPAAQQERAVAEPVTADAPQIAAMPAVPELTIVEPVTAKAQQFASVPGAKSEGPSETVPTKSNDPPLKARGDVQNVKPSLARSTAKSRHSSQASINGGPGRVRQASVPGSKPSVVAFPVD